MARDFKQRPNVNGVGVLLQGEGPTLVNLASDVANANATANTLADIPGLGIPVVAGVPTRFYFEILYDAAATTTGARFSVNGPAAPTRLSYMVTMTNATAAGGTGVAASHHNAYGAGVLGTFSPYTTGNLVIIEGIIVPSANGTLVPRFSSEVASSAITVKAGSSAMYW